MCGLIGCAGNITFKEEKVLRTLLILDSLRGEDSTGVAFIPAKDEPLVAKELGSPFNLFDSKRFVNGMRVINRAILGHNRYATMGGVSRANAHPFEFDSLIGMHNGTLRNKYKLEDHAQFSVDSENLYHHIDKRGLRSALDVVDGAYALTWWDKHNETVNLLRNSERHLYIASNTENTVLFWASESWMLEVACSRFEIEIGKPSLLPENMHYSWHIPASREIQKAHVKKEVASFTPIKPPATLAVVKGGNPPVPVKKLLTGKEAPSSTSYSSGKIGVTLEITSSRQDAQGAHYITLMDVLEPGSPVRLYVHKTSTIRFMVGRSITANVPGTWYVKPDGGFYRATPQSVVILPDTSAAAFLYDNGKGQLLNKKEWEEKFQHCEWCFDKLYAEDHGNRLTDSGACLCGKCAGDSSLTTGMKLKAVY